MKNLELKFSTHTPLYVLLGIFLLSHSQLFSASLIGYQAWAKIQPRVKIISEPGERIPIDVHLELHCDGAREMLISNDPDFEQENWQEYEKKVKWRLARNQTVTTVWVIFKRKNRRKGIYEITKPVTYSVNREAPSKKLSAYSSGLVDWSASEILVEAKGGSVEGSGDRYGLAEAQGGAEKKLYMFSYEVLKNVPIDHFYRVKDFLKINQELYDFINKSLKVMYVDEILYPTRTEVLIRSKLPLYGTNDHVGYFHLFGSYLEKKDFEIYDDRVTSFDNLIVDTRGFDMTLCLFPALINPDGELAYSKLMSGGSEGAFVKYVRVVDEKIDTSKTLYIKAAGVHNDDKSQIIISDYYRKIILGNKKNIENFSSGGFTLVVD